MRHVRRRVYTTTISLVAVLVVMAAIVSGLFRLAVEATPGFREDLALWVGELAGRPVSIAQTDLTWSGLTPQLELGGVVMFEPDSGVAALRAQSIKLGVSWTQLLSGNLQPDRVEFAGLTVVAVRGEDGRWRVRGAPSPGARSTSGKRLDEVIEQLAGFSRLRLERCTLVIEGVHQDGPVALQIDEATTQQSSGGFTVRLDGELPPAFGERVTARIRVQGDANAVSEWSGDWRLVVDGLGGAWFGRWLRAGVRIDSDALQAEISGPIVDGTFNRADLRLNARQVTGVTPQGAMTLDQLRLHAQWRRDPDQWEVELRRLSAGGATPWDVGDGYLRVRPAADAGAFSLRADLDRLPLDALAPWTAIIDLKGGAWTDNLATLGGDLRGLVLRVNREPDGQWRYAYRAALEAVDVQSPSLQVGGLQGNVSGSERGGRLTLPDESIQLALPEILFAPVMIDRLGGQIEWRHDQGATTIRTSELVANFMGAETRSRLELTLAKDAAPVIDLQTDLSAADATMLKPLMPRKWGRPLRQWLGERVVQGRVPNGQLRIRGALDQFPFDGSGEEGEFALDLDVASASLDFADGWPVATDLDAQLSFRGNGLSISADRGSLAGMPVERVSARFADFRDRLLTVKVQLRGKGKPAYDMLRRSPISQSLAGLLDNTELRGSVPVELALTIPLRKGARPDVAGSILLEEATLSYAALDAPFENLIGLIRFDGDDITAQDVKAHFLGAPVRAAIAPIGAGRNELSLMFPVSYGGDSRLVDRFVPSWLADRLAGIANWSANVVIGRGSDGVLRLRGDMQQVAVDLPDRLGKAAGVPAQLAIDVRGEPDRTRLGLRYDNRLTGDLTLGSSSASRALLAAHLHLGDSPRPPLDIDGIVITGAAARFDYNAWQGLFETWSGGDGSLPLAVRDLAIGEVAFDAFSLADLRVSLDRQASRMTLDLDGPGARGTVAWERDTRHHLQARLEHLRVAYAPTQGESDGVLDPTALPTLDFDVDALAVNGAAFGSVNIASSRLDDGQRLTAFRVDGGLLQARLEGQWWRQDGRSGAELAVDSRIGDIGRVLSAFGYARNIDARDARFNADLRWSPSAAGIDWAQARGALTLRADDGRLRAVEPGAGRVLGLVNFYALPRRLSFNFKDVVGEGLSFDTIKGTFQLGDGQARTDNLTVEAPSLRMETRGRIGLVDRDYDQRVTVYPDVSAGVTLASALFGGPAVGALVLLAQEVLDKPLDQATQLSYHLTGSWDDPQVAKADK